VIKNIKKTLDVIARLLELRFLRIGVEKCPEGCF